MGSFPDATKWLKQMRAFYNCCFSEYTWTVGSSDAGDLNRWPEVRIWHCCVHLHGVIGARVGAAVGPWSPHCADWDPRGCAFPPGHALLFLASGKQKGTGCAGLILSLSSSIRHGVCIQGYELKNTPWLDSSDQEHTPDTTVQWFRL